MIVQSAKKIIEISGLDLSMLHLILPSSPFFHILLPLPSIKQRHTHTHTLSLSPQHEHDLAANVLHYLVKDNREEDGDGLHEMAEEDNILQSSDLHLFPHLGIIWGNCSDGSSVPRHRRRNMTSSTPPSP